MRRLVTLRHVRLGIKSLMLHKLRSFLTMLGVVCGVCSVIAMLSIAAGASQKAMEDIKKLGSNNIIIRAIKPPQDEQAGQAGQRSMSVDYGLFYEDLKRMEEGLPALHVAVPAKIVNQEARLGSRTTNIRLVGTTPDWFRLVPRELIAGRLLNEQDMREHAPVCVLAEGAVDANGNPKDAARKLLGTSHTIGQTVTIGGNAYVVVGIIRNGPETGESSGSAHTPDQATDAYAPLPVVRERHGDTNVQRGSGTISAERVELHQIILQVGDTEAAESFENVLPTFEAVKTMLARFHKKPDYAIDVPLAQLKIAREQSRMYSIVLGLIAGISLLVGGIGIMNIMLASVTERTREIGIRRAIGAKRRQIIGQFLIETVVLSSLGGIIGVALGIASPPIIEHYARMPTVVTLWSVLLSLCISVAVGIFFGFYPAYRAAMLDPIVALRHE